MHLVLDLSNLFFSLVDASKRFPVLHYSHQILRVLHLEMLKSSFDDPIFVNLVCMQSFPELEGACYPLVIGSGETI